MKQKEIWLVQYPQTSVGHEYRKERPALVIESDSQLKRTDVFSVIPLTSNLNNKTIDDILIRMNKKNNLFRNSILKVYHLESFDYSRFIKKIGEIDSQILNKVKSYLKIHFDL